MFTGIIKETGKIRGVSEGNECKLIEISCNQILKDLSAGDSVVDKFRANSYRFHEND